MPGAYRVKIEPCDPGATISVDTINVASPQSDTVYKGDVPFQGIIKVSPDNMASVRLYMAKLALGYVTNLAAAQTAINNITP